MSFHEYHNGPKLYSVDPDQTASRWSTLFANPSASFGCITLLKINISQFFKIITVIFLGVQIFRSLRYKAIL